MHKRDEKGSRVDGATSPVSQFNTGDNAIQIGKVWIGELHVPVTIVAAASEPDAESSYGARERALGVLSIALMLLTACVAVPQIEMKIPLWLAGCAAAGLGAWLNDRSRGGQG